MREYLETLEKVMLEGNCREDRTGTGTTDLFGAQMRIDLGEGFPLLTTKKINFRNVVGELIWILRGHTNNNDLREITYGKGSTNKTIWEQWAHPETGELGAVYGQQLRYWNYRASNQTHYVDQLESLIKNLKEKPFSRRHVVSLWNATDLPLEGWEHDKNINAGFGVLPPCHCLFQFHVHEFYGDMYLSCQLYQRSADMFIGVPYNIASYALLTHMIANHLDYRVGDFIHTFGSAHVYSNHYKQVKKQLKRKPTELPRLIIKGERDNIWEHEVSDFELEGYNPQGFIKAPVSV